MENQITPSNGWLKGNEWEWAQEYIQAKAGRSLERQIERLNDGPRSFKATIDAISRLQKYPEGELLIARLRNALRQRRYRAGNASRQSKPYTFTLPTSIKDRLSLQAAKQGISETDLLIELIEYNKKINEQAVERNKELKQLLRKAREEKQNDKRVHKEQLAEAMQHIEQLTRSLVEREISSEMTSPEAIADTAAVDAEVKKRTSEIEHSICNAIRFHPPSKLRRFQSGS